MPITIKEIDKIAFLARLYFDEEEKIILNQQINQILDCMEQLKEVATENIEPLTPISEKTTFLREDTQETFTKTKNLLNNAPEKGKGHYLVPKVIQDQ